MACVKWGWIPSVVLFAAFAALKVFAQQVTKITRYAPDTQPRAVCEGKCWTSSM